MEKPQIIPLSHIKTTTLPRDRTFIDADAQAELQASIRQNGLRLPIELTKIDDTYALISGYRRLLAFEALLENTGSEEYTTIPAFIRKSTNRQDALAAMVEENEIRQNLSPWERARVVITAHNMEIFDTIDAALTTLFPQISRQKRAKLRAITEVVEMLDGHLIDPEHLTQNQLIRLAQCVRLDWTKIIVACIAEQRDPSGPTQWNRLLPIIQEAEMLVSENRSTNPNRPRRLMTPRAGINVRRERTRDGYILYITGKRANGGLMSSVLETIEVQLSDA